MKIKEFIRQLEEYMKIYGPDMEIIIQNECIEYDYNCFKKFSKIENRIIDGLDYMGNGQILITSHEE